ncbi:MAG: hypothetical protein NTY38_21540 [Acidobacteria bacterium]|nr:hypothetical protein [Acidobacteriota bacterium]
MSVFAFHLALAGVMPAQFAEQYQIAAQAYDNVAQACASPATKSCAQQFATYNRCMAGMMQRDASCGSAPQCNATSPAGGGSEYRSATTQLNSRIATSAQEQQQAAEALNQMIQTGGAQLNGILGALMARRARKAAERAAAESAAIQANPPCVVDFNGRPPDVTYCAPAPPPAVAEFHGVPVQPEVENWRSPLAGIPPSSAGQLGEHRATQLATGELGGG